MTNPITTRQFYKLSYTFLGLILCSLVAATPTTHTTTHVLNSTVTTADFKAEENYLCPTDCHCVLAHNTHTPFLHAKCSSLKGLRAEEHLQATLPIHSIDLSFLNLTRLSHSLENLPDLTSIDLSHNDLHEIGHLGRRIKKLNLKHNRINSSKLTKLPQHVQSLNLQHNDITHLPLEFTKLNNLQSLELAHNQINCSCETLEVRNWLQERHVFMEHPVKCFYPTLYKNKSWLQVKQSLVCEKEKRPGYDNAEEEENELMMGDQPFEGSGDEIQDDEELGKDFMPIDTNTKKTVIARSSALTALNDVEGSGDLNEMSLPLDMLGSSSTQATAATEHTTEAPEEDDEGSGSGGGLLFIPAIHSGRVITDDFDVPASQEEDDDFNDLHKHIEEPAVEQDIFHHSLGIFDGDEKPRPSTEEPAIVEDEIEPVVVPSLGEGNEPSTEGPTSDAVAHAKMGEGKDDSNATYLLLGVIGLIVIGLLFYVAIKRCKHTGRHGRDAENPQTELVAMDKKQLGKPLRNGVPEHVPLIGEKTKSDMAKPINGSKPYDADTKDGAPLHEPLLNGNGNAKGTANGNGAVHNDEPEDSRPNSQLQAPHEYYPISPRYPPPQSPRASKYSQQPQPAEPNNNDPNQPYLPSSPKLGRYSPVYSPETGRVKIKLSETPRPKTPMLVTRSRSNAGDIITVPVRPIQTASFQATPIYTAATNGHAVGEH